MSILCEHFRVEMDVVDIQHTRVEKFGENKFQNRILLIYDGIHYDPLLEDSSTKQRSVFPAMMRCLPELWCLQNQRNPNDSTLMQKTLNSNVWCVVKLLLRTVTQCNMRERQNILISGNIEK